MAGGPINGGYNAADERNPNSILIPTMVQMSTDIMDYWMNMTCLYDPYHTVDGDKVTLPICMFHVKKIVPTRTIEVSKQRVILYEPQNDGKDHRNTLRTGVMQTIVDNAVKQPTTYNMEIIVPFQPIGKYYSMGVRFIRDIISGIGEFAGAVNRDWESWFAGATAITSLANQIAVPVSKLAGMDGSAYININSLEAMADSCRMLCMKMWTGFDYKFVMITGMSYDKQPNEDDVVRATLNLQEMPVLEIFKNTHRSIDSSRKNWAAKALGATYNTLLEPLTGMTGVKKQAVVGGIV